MLATAHAFDLWYVRTLTVQITGKHFELVLVAAARWTADRSQETHPVLAITGPYMLIAANMRRYVFIGSNDRSKATVQALSFVRCRVVRPLSHLVIKQKHQVKTSRYCQSDCRKC